MSWIINALFQTLVFLGFGWWFLHVQSVYWKILIVLAGGFFIWRATTNPDFIYRRLARSCALGAIATITLQKSAKLEWSGGTEAGTFLHKLVVAIGDNGELAAMILLVASLGFGLLDLLRMHLQQSSTFGLVTEPFEAHGQYIDLRGENNGAYSYQVELSVINKSGDVAAITSADLVRDVSFFGRYSGNVFVRIDNVLKPPNNFKIEVAPHTRADLVATFEFRDSRRRFLARCFPRLIRLYDKVFGQFTLRLGAHQRWARSYVQLETRV